MIVVGGGIQGAAIAREAALRDLRVLLVERDDFAAGTSSRSSRLIHGGLRYMQQGHLALVREALHERERLFRLAPHLVRPLPMLMPFFTGGSKRPWMMKLGLRLYGLLAGGQSVPKARSLTSAQCGLAFPGIRQEGLLGGAMFFDGVTEDQRLTVAVVEAAKAAGAAVLNHVAVLAGADGELQLQDALTGMEFKLRCRHLVNAAGPEVDGVRRLLGVDATSLVRLSRGSHLVLPAMECENALAAFLPDQRIQFVIPHADGTLCGTTEVEEADGNQRAGVPEEDIEYLLHALEYLLEDPPARADVRHAYVGWRALPLGKGPAGAMNREAYMVHEQCAAGDLHTVVGGKLTTHRSFAERAVNALLGRRDPSPSREIHLPGGAGPREVGDPLWWRHGSQAPGIRALGKEDADWLQPICPHRDLLRVEAVHAIRNQAAMTFTDLMLRRLFHSQGPCLQDDCMDAMHALFASQLASATPAAQAKAELRAEVQALRGELVS